MGCSPRICGHRLYRPCRRLCRARQVRFPRVPPSVHVQRYNLSLMCRSRSQSPALPFVFLHFFSPVTLACAASSLGPARRCLVSFPF